MDGRTRNAMRRQIRTIERAIISLKRSVSRLVPALKRATTGTSGTGLRRSSKLTAKARANLKLQGRYMGYMRQLKPKQKTEVRKLREQKGVEAAIKHAQALSSGSSKQQPRPARTRSPKTGASRKARDQAA